MAKASAEQLDLMKQWHDRSGFEFMGLDEVDATDPRGFIALWTKNVDWLDDVLNEVDSLIDDYDHRYFEEQP